MTVTNFSTRVDILDKCTPLHLLILLHYFASPEPYSKGDADHANSEASVEYTTALVRAGLLRSATTENFMEYGGRYTTTEKGDRLVRAVCANAAAFSALL